MSILSFQGLWRRCGWFCVSSGICSFFEGELHEETIGQNISDGETSHDKSWTGIVQPGFKLPLTSFCFLFPLKSKCWTFIKCEITLYFCIFRERKGCVRLVKKETVWPELFTLQLITRRLLLENRLAHLCVSIHWLNHTKIISGNYNSPA